MNKGTILIIRPSDEAHNISATYIEEYWKSKNYEVSAIRPEKEFGGLEKIIQITNNTNVVLVIVSSINGHTPLFMEVNNNTSFQHIKSLNKDIYVAIGGNLYPGKEQQLPIKIKKDLEEIGFNSVLHNPSFDKTIEFFEKIDAKLQNKDNHTRISLPNFTNTINQFLKPFLQQDNTKIYNKKLSLDIVNLSINEAIQEYIPTSLDLIKSIKKYGIVDTIIQNFKNIESKIKSNIVDLPTLQNEAYKNKEILLQARTGVGNLEEQKKLWELMTQVGAKVVSYQVDSETRNHHFKELEEQFKNGNGTISNLNGIPVVNMGYQNLLDKLTLKFLKQGFPIEVRDGSADGILLKLHALLSGCTSLEGSSLCYLLPYFPDFPIQQSMQSYQVIDWICGELAKQNIIIDREYFGVQTAHIPHAIAGVTNILEAMMSAEQGVKCVSLGFAESGNRTHDIAMARVTKNLTKEYLKDYDIDIHVVWNTYMAAFPKDEYEASKLIFESAISAQKSGVVTKMLTKSPVEQSGIPDGFQNAIGVSLSKKGIEMAHLVSINEDDIKIQEELLELQIRTILDPIVNGKKEELPQRIIQFLKSGQLYVFGSPHSISKNAPLKYTTFRGIDGAYYMYAEEKTLQSIFYNNNKLVQIHLDAWKEKQKLSPSFSFAQISFKSAGSEIVDSEYTAPFSGEDSIFTTKILEDIKIDIQNKFNVIYK